MKRRFCILLGVLAGVLFCLAPAMADTMVIPLSTWFDTGQTGNFGTVTLQTGDFNSDTFQDVKFTIYSAGSILGGTPDLHEFFFNSNLSQDQSNSLNASGFTAVTAPQAFSHQVHPDVLTNDGSTTPFKADGDGNYDFYVFFGHGGTITSTGAFYVSLANTNLSISNFANYPPYDSRLLSVGGAKGAFTMAAHWQSTTFGLANSHYVGGSPVPIPGALVLLTAGMVRLATYARRRKSLA